MRITLDLPDDLLEEARLAANLATEREIVVAGLEELIRWSRREELRRLAGRIELGVAVAASRERPEPRR